MKAISLWQPWASLIAAGAKTIETRSWAPPKAIIGQRIAIHAAKRKPTSDDLEVLQNLDKMPVGFMRHPQFGSIMPDGRGRMALGQVLATAVLADAWQVSNDSTPTIYDDGYPMVYQARDIFDNADKCAKADPYGDFGVGRWLWFLEDIQKLDPPVPEKGHQGFWNWDAP